MAKTIVCVDPAFAATGVVVMSYDGAAWTLVDAGLIETEKSDKKRGVRVADDTVERSRLIFRSLSQVVEQHKASALACELPSGGGKSASAVKAMALATGIIACLAERYSLPSEWLSPSEVKEALAGCKNAGKPAMMATALKLHPQLSNWCRKGRPLNKFEHVADAVGVFEAARNGQVVRMLERV